MDVRPLKSTPLVCILLALLMIDKAPIAETGPLETIEAVENPQAPKPPSEVEPEGQPREEVIDDLPSNDAVVNDLDDPKLSLPLDREPPRTLSETFANPSDFFREGAPKRLVVLTADWCKPCQQYKQNMTGLNVSESFDAEIQLVDVDKYPHLWNLLRQSDSIPQTLLFDGNSITQFVGTQNNLWLQQKLGKQPAMRQVEKQPQPRNTYAKPTQYYYQRLTPKQMRINRRYGRWSR